MRSLLRTLAAATLASLTAAQSANTSYFFPNSTGFRLQHGFETVLVQPYGYDGFRVRSWPFRPPTGDEISFLYDPPLEGPENGQSLGMKVDQKINGSTPTVLRNGNTIVRTYSAKADNTTHVRLAFYRVEADGSERLLTGEYYPKKALNPRYYQWRGDSYDFEAQFSFSSSPNEQIFGTGQQTDHLVNKKGQSIDLINFNTHIPTPVFMSNKGYAFIWNSAAQGRMEFSPLRTRFTSDTTTLVDYVIMSAEEGDYDALQKKLTAATGRAPPPPDWSLGYLHSKLRYENQSEFIQLAQDFHDRNIPVSMLVIDYQSWAHQGDWALDPALWPNVSYMAERVKELTGAEIMASLWPSVEDASVNYDTMQLEGYLAATRSGPGVTDSWNGSYIRNIDSTNPDARAFLWNTLRENYYIHGIKNFWIDQADGGNLGEAWQNNGQSNYIESIPYPFDNALYHAGTQKSVGKLYPWAHQQALEEGQRNATGTETGDPCDYLSLSRSGYIGSQRFCSIVWSGDTSSVWETLASQVSAGLSAAATGWGWWTLDIGGFEVDATVPWSANIDTPEYRELYVRWQQFATFLPFMRNHGNRQCDSKDAFTCDNEPWSYGEENTPTIVSYINLRYQLAPYIKALFQQLNKSGRAIMRPLYMDFGRSDGKIDAMTAANTNVTTQQFMFGPRILVTPVTTPGVSEWTVYLPLTPGENATMSSGNATSYGSGMGGASAGSAKPWTYFWTNSTYAGGQSVTVPAPLEHVPVFHLGRREEIMSGEVF